VPRYYFPFVWPDDVVRDTKGTELEGLSAAHRHAIGLVHQVRASLSDVGDSWLIEICDGGGGKPLVVLPSTVSALRRQSRR
jgi:hypothetical protein